MNKKNLKKFFTKRKILFLVNVVYLILTIITCFFTIGVTCGLPVYSDSIYDVLVIVFGFVGSQATFTVMTLIVYYLAIMAGALNKKYKEEVKDTEYEDKK